MNGETKSFISHVKSGGVKQPTQIGFSEKSWRKAFNDFDNTSEKDEKLFVAGLWFFKYLSDIRSELKKYNDKVIDLNKLRQLYVAIINRDYSVAEAAMFEHLEVESNKQSKISIGAIAEKKLPIGPNDYNVHILGAIESGLSSLRFPLSETFLNVKVKNKSLGVA